jgi:hypothetical protein
MNVENRAEAAQFLFREYINRSLQCSGMELKFFEQV